MEPSVWDVISGALRLNDETFVSLIQSSHVYALSIIILALVGTSWMLGHCAVLFLNQVPRGRFLVTMIGLAASFVLGALIWVTSTWLVTTLFPGNRNVPLRMVCPSPPSLCAAGAEHPDHHSVHRLRRRGGPQYVVTLTWCWPSKCHSRLYSRRWCALLGWG
jgi:hypothetical protein